MPKKSLENLTESMFYVLMAFSTGPLCGIEIAEFVRLRTDGRVKLGPATLYTILAKFEKFSYISQIHTDGRKRTYRLTEKGLSAYHGEVARLRQCVLDADQESVLPLSRTAIQNERRYHTYERHSENRAF